MLLAIHFLYRPSYIYVHFFFPLDLETIQPFWAFHSILHNVIVRFGCRRFISNASLPSSPFTSILLHLFSLSAILRFVILQLGGMATIQLLPAEEWGKIKGGRIGP
jgi:hypothetical protein